jgi:hypothetical protein
MPPLLREQLTLDHSGVSFQESKQWIVMQLLMLLIFQPKVIHYLSLK